MAKLYDISMLIHADMQVYKNKDEKRPQFETTSDFTTGSAHETRLHLDAHTGTHIDAELHMIPNGRTIEAVGLEKLVRSCRVIDLTAVTGGITKADLEPHNPQAGEFLLFKTRNSFEETFNFEFIYLAADGAEYLANIGISGVGIDGLGVERAQPNHETHVSLLSKDIVILEGLRLKDVPAGTYFMVALPLKLTGIDAAPARVVLLEGLPDITLA
ncbi:cyclase family protein [Alicyclobacillus hesperidum URH17-3-68]|uniref:cyclase family protein n=1 Tax=Alicyclobacillus hesperidum TaxID=89784 RepID=UPI000281C2F2|nr:cyclase family protein [Alicyclobacillus hesperidum]EJY54895.1 cyclase family protein [Alicyclobacillus hesperidum URH17-3-68]